MHFPLLNWRHGVLEKVLPVLSALQTPSHPPAVAAPPASAHTCSNSATVSTSSCCAMNASTSHQRPYAKHAFLQLWSGSARIQLSCGGGDGGGGGGDGGGEGGRCRVSSWT